MSVQKRRVPVGIDEHLDQIIALCKRFHVIELGVFGSAATGAFDIEASDFDFLVEFDPEAPIAPLEQYFGFISEMQSLLRRKVDIISYRSIRNPYFKASVDEQRIDLYAA